MMNLSLDLRPLKAALSIHSAFARASAAEQSLRIAIARCARRSCAAGAAPLELQLQNKVLMFCLLQNRILLRRLFSLNESAT